jgi:hypothetical protein
MQARSCVTPEGAFRVGFHHSAYTIENLRDENGLASLGRSEDGQLVDNATNFPQGDLQVEATDGVYEIANPFAFRGATFIKRSWAENAAEALNEIRIPARAPLSMTDWLARHLTGNRQREALADLPEALLLTLATNSTDPRDLIALAETACEFVTPEANAGALGLRYVRCANGQWRPHIQRPLLFEAVANNPHLPDAYKDAMVLRPGAQGASEIVGVRGARGADTHVYEYLRRNSYIPWGHLAANMANDAVRYDVKSLSAADMAALRHLYYQRTYVRLARAAGIERCPTGRGLHAEELEALRREVVHALSARPADAKLRFDRTLWGWNFGYDYAPSGYRLHASHQQVHQQYALIPPRAACSEAGEANAGRMPAFACGDLVEDFVAGFRQLHGVDFFECYAAAVERNRRTDGRPDRPRSLVVHRDAQVMLFVPKAQTSQWELQLMPLTPVGNILEADTAMRRALDRALLIALHTLGAMGARLVTSIELSKRFDAGATGQRLLYSILPKLPESPGAFSEAQLRWIVGHYPEDFAAACRAHLPTMP